jgi:hypothetical protein
VVEEAGLVGAPEGGERRRGELAALPVEGVQPVEEDVGPHPLALWRHMQVEDGQERVHQALGVRRTLRRPQPLPPHGAKDGQHGARGGRHAAAAGSGRGAALQRCRFEGGARDELQQPVTLAGDHRGPGTSAGRRWGKPRRGRRAAAARQVRARSPGARQTRAAPVCLGGAGAQRWWRTRLKSAPDMARGHQGLQAWDACGAVPIKRMQQSCKQARPN